MNALFREVRLQIFPISVIVIAEEKDGVNDVASEKEGFV
jgi:hypothetical protein